MYTIGEASARSGVGSSLIRAWERRYGVVEPTRTPGGYRLYDDDAIRVLRTMRTLVDSGWTASQAALAIASGAAPAEVEAAGTTAALEPRPAAAADHRARLVDRFVRAAEEASAPDTEAALDDIFAAGSFEAIVDDILLPAVAALGMSWLDDRMSVAAEHAASHAVVRRLAAVYQAAGVPARTTVVVGLPPGSRHELGALAFAAAIRRRGLGVLYLGPDVPADGWIDAVVRTRAKAAVIGVVTDIDRAPAAEVIEALRGHGLRLVAVGGAAASSHPSLGEGVICLPGRIVDAAASLAVSLGRRA